MYEQWTRDQHDAWKQIPKEQDFKKAVETMAHLQHGLENAYNDVRCASGAMHRGDDVTEKRLLDRVEATLADALTILSLRLEMWTV